MAATSAVVPNRVTAAGASGAASENVYLQIRPEREALRQLEITTRLVP